MILRGLVTLLIYRMSWHIRSEKNPLCQNRVDLETICIFLRVHALQIRITVHGPISGIKPASQGTPNIAIFWLWAHVPLSQCESDYRNSELR